jgi:hypothetical protein
METPMKNLDEILKHYGKDRKLEDRIDDVLYEIGHWLWINRKHDCPCPKCEMRDWDSDDYGECLNQHLRDYDMVYNYVMGRIDKEHFEKEMGIGSNFLQDDDKR